MADGIVAAAAVRPRSRSRSPAERSCSKSAFLGATSGSCPSFSSVNFGGVTSPDELAHVAAAAKAARLARNSLRGYLAALTKHTRRSPTDGTLLRADETQCGGSGSSSCTTARARALRDLEELRRCTSASPPLAVTQVLQPATLPRCSGAQPRQEVQQQFAVPTSSGVQDFVPRLRLRLADCGVGDGSSFGVDSGPQKQVRVLAVALQEENEEAVGLGKTFASGRVALVLSPGCVEVWERDAFSWHHAATSRAYEMLWPTGLVSAASAAWASSTLGDADHSSFLWVAFAQSNANEALVVMLFAAGETHSGATTDTSLRLVASGGCGAGSAVRQVSPSICSLSALAPTPYNHSCQCQASAQGVTFAATSVATGDATRAVLRTVAWYREEGDGSEGRVGEADALHEVASCPLVRRGVQQRMAAESSNGVEVAGLWPLTSQQSPCSTGAGPCAASFAPAASSVCRVVVWLRDGTGERGLKGGGGELQILGAAGECIALLPLADRCLSVAVPPLPRCLPARPLQQFGPSFVVVLLWETSDALAHQAEWVTAIAVPKPGAACQKVSADPTHRGASASPAQMELRRLRLPATISAYGPNTGQGGADLDTCVVRKPWEHHRVIAVSDRLLGCMHTSSSSAYVLDWQHDRSHHLPAGWRPLAAGRRVLIACSSGVRYGAGEIGEAAEVDDLVFLEPP